MIPIARSWSKRSATTFALGARVGLGRMLSPSPPRTASKPGLDLVSRSRGRCLTAMPAPRRSAVTLRVHWVAQSLLGLGRDAGEKHLARPVMDEEQQVRPRGSGRSPSPGVNLW